jgi:hypothetical protein
MQQRIVQFDNTQIHQYSLRNYNMANHAYVTTKKHMTPEKVRSVLDRLNTELFFDCLVITDTVYDDGTSGWHICIKGESEYVLRQCWLNSRRSFEIRHGGGTDFIWWVDQRIQDEISKVFDGRVKDDGGDGWDEVLTSWNMADSYPEHIKRRIESYKKWAIAEGRVWDHIWVMCLSKMRWMLWDYPKSYREPYKAAQRKKKHAHA